jgi:hypothetical protein
MTNRYKYISALPMVFMELSYGPGTSVTHAASPGVPDEDGATVVLYPGDFLETDTEIASAWLEPVTVAAAKAAKAAAPSPAALQPAVADNAAGQAESSASIPPSPETGAQSPGPGAGTSGGTQPTTTTTETD